ncbi:TPR repeat region-containing protein [Mycolicibacterium mageritense]|uniref:ESX-1 secretion-associated protein EspA/EspE-like domain-containing protein n=1 Tax=Mycolicibacterium mageritense TaxID=53462 RepID=A0AAI8XN11_MYCME|nr:EspA/EspE family type VII secretion system effector [Mycolicibacterium mageritense]BDY28407.1 hypothetical protein hbim_02341 [Mycolicibacterium mageritense]
MGALDAFYSTWSDARETFGQGTPQDGSNLDNSSKLMQMKAGVEAAAPDGRWQGPASEAYAAKNKDHAGVYGKLAELDTKMATEVTNASNVVTAGRQSLDITKSWVDSAVKALPSGLSASDRDAKLLSIANEGIGKVSTIVTEATNKMTDISGRVQGLKGEYQALGNDKTAPGEKPGISFATDPSKNDDKKPGLNSDNGKDDGTALQNETGTPMSAEARNRLLEAGTLPPDQAEALARGEKVNVGAERMAYLYQLSQSLNGKSPAEIKSIMDRMPEDERAALSRGLAIVSNKNALSGVPNTEGVTDATRDTFIPAAGSLANLPTEIKDELTRSDRNVILPATDSNPAYYRGVPELHDISEIFRPAAESSAGTDSNGNPISPGYAMNGSEAGKLMLSAVSEYANHDIDNRARPDYPYMPGGAGDAAPSKLPDPTPALADVAQVGGRDHVGMSELVTNEDMIGVDSHGNAVRSNEYFLRGMLQETWGEHSSKVGDAFSWMRDDPHISINAQTANAVAHYVSDHKAGFVDIPGSATTFGSTNPALSEAVAMGLGPYVGAFTGNAAAPELFNMPDIHQFANQGQMADLLSVLDQNHNSGIIINDAIMQQQRMLEVVGIASDDHHRELEISGRLEGAMHAGIEDAKQTDQKYKIQQVEQQYASASGAIQDTWAKGKGALSGFASLIPEAKVPMAIVNALEPWVKPSAGDMPSTVNIGGDDFLKQYVEARSPSTSTYYENSAILEGLLQRNPEISRNAELAPFITQGESGPTVNLDKVAINQTEFVKAFNSAITDDVFDKTEFDNKINNDGRKHTEWNDAKPPAWK